MAVVVVAVAFVVEVEVEVEAVVRPLAHVAGERERAPKAAAASLVCRRLSSRRLGVMTQ